MSPQTSYNSLKKRFSKVKEGESDFRKIRRIKSGEEGKYSLGSTEHTRYFLTNELSGFNSRMNNGGFSKAADREAWKIRNALVGNNYLTKKEKTKYLDMFNKRIERGVNYLEKHPSEMGFKEMGVLLKYSNQIERDIKKSSDIGKFFAVLSIGSVLAGIFFLSPNLTGNVIGNLAKNTSSIFGAGLFVLGVLGAFLTLKR